MLAADFEVARSAFTVRIEIRIQPGERVAVLGRSGAGKTTFLEALAGLVRLTRGEIQLDGRRLSSGVGPAGDVPLGQRRVGLLRQKPGLFPHLTVLDNIRYPSGATPAAAASAAQRMGLGGLLQVRPQGLSGGEAQRAALCRVLQSEVRLLCLDEPFSSLDRPLSLELLELVSNELQGRGTAALLVTHHLQEAQAFADRVVILDQGAVLQVADPRELVLRPRTAVVAALVGYRGFLRRGGAVMAVHPDRLRRVGSGDGGATLSGTVVGMRPEGARLDVELEAVGEWVGRFHALLDEPPRAGVGLDFEVLAAPVFPGPGGGLD